MSAITGDPGAAPPWRGQSRTRARLAATPWDHRARRRGRNRRGRVGGRPVDGDCAARGAAPPADGRCGRRRCRRAHRERDRRVRMTRAVERQSSRARSPPCGRPPSTRGPRVTCAGAWSISAVACAQVSSSPTIDSARPRSASGASARGGWRRRAQRCSWLRPNLARWRALAADSAVTAPGSSIRCRRPSTKLVANSNSAEADLRRPGAAQAYERVGRAVRWRDHGAQRGPGALVGTAGGVSETLPAATGSAPGSLFTVRPDRHSERVRDCARRLRRGGRYRAAGGGDVARAPPAILSRARGAHGRIARCHRTDAAHGGAGGESQGRVPARDVRPGATRARPGHAAAAPARHCAGDP